MSITDSLPFWKHCCPRSAVCLLRGNCSVLLRLWKENDLRNSNQVHIFVPIPESSFLLQVSLSNFECLINAQALKPSQRNRAVRIIAVLAAILASRDARQFLVHAAFSIHDDGIHIKEVFVSILAHHSPPDRKIKLVACQALPARHLWRSDDSYRRLPAKLVLPDVAEHRIHKRVPNCQKFRLSIPDRRRPIKRNHLEAFGKVLGTQTLRRQELQKTVLALHLSALFRQQLQRKFF